MYSRRSFCRVSLFLIRRSSIAEYFIVTNGIAFLTTTVPRVTLHGVNIAVLNPFYYAYMVGASVLPVCIGIIPIEENDIARSRLIAAVLPKAAFLEPCHTGGTPCELRNNAVFYIPALIGYG